MAARERHHRKIYNEARQPHELTFGCYQGYPLLSKERSCVWLAEAILIACEKLRFSLWAYVFMPNHVHLIVRPKDDVSDVSSLLKQIKLQVSRRAIAFLRKNSPEWSKRLQLCRGTRTEYHFWQRGGGYDRNIVEPQTLSRMIDYIHLNPVRKRFVEKTSDWKWSSAGWFEGQAPNALPVERIPPEWTVIS